MSHLPACAIHALPVGAPFLRPRIAVNHLSRRCALLFFFIQTQPEQHYDTWLRRILDAFRTQLDPRDRAFARFLLDLPELSDETLEMVREMCVERPDAVKVIGFATLRELVTMRVPVRDAALHILLDLTTHPGGFIL